MIEYARPKIFDFSYPLYEGINKQEFETNIIRNFYMREIGLETYALWKFFLQNKMIEIMPYYNKLFEEQFKYGQLELFGDADLTIHKAGDHNIDRTNSLTGNGTNKGTINTSNEKSETYSGIDSTNSTNKITESLENTHNDTENRTDKGNSTNRYSDTPQGGLNGMNSINNNLYLTNATLDDHDNTITDTKNGGYTNNRNSDETTTSSTNYGKKINDNITGEQTEDFSTTKKEDNHGKEDKLYNETITEIGRRGNIDYTKIYSEFFDKFQNIYKKLYSDLESLFMNVW